MPKLLLHFLVALGLWFGLTHFEVHLGVRLVAIIAGAFLVDFVWERMFSNPLVRTGTKAIAADDPVMADAISKAKDTFGKFLEIYPEHRRDSTVRFRWPSDTGTIEHVWGDLLEISEDKAKIYLRTLPASQKAPRDRTMTIDRDQINDWQVEFDDGTLRGGYTNRAVFKVIRREEGELHPELQGQLERFKDIDW